MSAKSGVRGAVIALLALVTALPLLASPVHAEPAAPRAEVQRGQNDLTIRVFGGTLAVEADNLVIRNNDGQAVDRVALSYVDKDFRTYPIDASVNGNGATLVPSRNAARSTKTSPSAFEVGRKPALKVICGPQTRKQRDKEALDQMNSELAAATAIGALAGAIIGAIIGLVGIVTIPIGAAVGGLLGAGGALAGAAINGTFARYLKTINSPFKPKVCNL